MTKINFEIKYTLTENDDQQITQFVDKCDSGHSFQLPWYSKIIDNQNKSNLSNKSKAFIIGKINNKIVVYALVGLNPVLLNKFGIVSIKRGPISDNVDYVIELVNYLKIEKKAKVINFTPFWGKTNDSDDLINKFKNENFNESYPPKVYTCTVRIDLSTSDEDILNNMKGNTRRDISKAERSGVNVIVNNSYESTNLFFENLYNFNEERKIDTLNKKTMEAYWKGSIINKNLGTILTAIHEDKIVGEILIGRYKKYSWYNLGYTQRVPKIPIHPILHWNAIKWAKNLNCLSYDLGGVKNPLKNDGDKVADFKLKFTNGVVYETFPEFEYKVDSLSLLASQKLKTLERRIKIKFNKFD